MRRPRSKSSLHARLAGSGVGVGGHSPPRGQDHPPTPLQVGRSGGCWLAAGYRLRGASSGTPSAPPSTAQLVGPPRRCGAVARPCLHEPRCACDSSATLQRRRDTILTIRPSDDTANRLGATREGSPSPNPWAPPHRMDPAPKRDGRHSTTRTSCPPSGASRPSPMTRACRSSQARSRSRQAQTAW